MYEDKILSGAVRISEARFRNENIAILKAHRDRISELEGRIVALLEAIEEAEEYIEELEDK
jgi:hypothetical protein